MIAFSDEENPLWTAWRYERPGEQTYEFSFWVQEQWRRLGEQLGLKPGGAAPRWPDVVMWYHGVQGGHALLIDFVVRRLAAGDLP